MTLEQLGRRDERVMIVEREQEKGTRTRYFERENSQRCALGGLIESHGDTKLKRARVHISRLSLSSPKKIFIVMARVRRVTDRPAEGESRRIGERNLTALKVSNTIV